MIRLTEALKLLAVFFVAITLLSACGGGSGGSGGSTSYQVDTVAATSGGSISPSSSVKAGSIASFTVTPNSGYAVSSVTGCGGTLSGSTYTTGAITADCTITASFVPQYTVTASAGANGTVSPSSAKVNSGATTTLTVTPNSGYGISSVTGCGGTLSGTTYTTGTISADCTVTASFIVQYVVTAMAGTGGTITPASSGVNAGDTTTLTITARSGYAITGVTGCGGTLSGGTFTTAAINAACTVTANFAPTFTWVGGSNVANAAGVYGTQGVAAATNIPGSRYDAARWTDAGGNFWLFGGYGGQDSFGHVTWSNDLWMYSPASGKWTWVSGLNVGGNRGNYGTQGVAASLNTPGARSAAVTWIDASGNLWLFGGYGFDSAGAGGYLNDLWKYSPSSNEWTWVAGSNLVGAAGNYGTRGTASAANFPGARDYAVSWTDANGDVWLFGGAGYDSTTYVGPLNDLWKYSQATGEWTWVSGSNAGNAPAVYGTKGVAAATNMPGGRNGAIGWTDANGNLWLFGGQGLDSTAVIDWLDDLWEYSPSSGEWTWVSGSSTGSAPSVYGTQGVAAVANVPGGRAGAAHWTDARGNFWLFGGQVTATDWSGDLWEYSPTNGEWTWVGGSTAVNAKGVYGTLGVSALANTPGTRTAATGWTDSSGNLWLFGGVGEDLTGTHGNLNDLWMYPTQ